MIRAEFVCSDRAFSGFMIQGHAGVAPAPHDILCAAVSAMSALTVNTLREVFSVPLEIISTEEPAFLKIRIPGDPAREAEGVIRGFYLQMKDLEKQYPSHLSVTQNRL